MSFIIINSIQNHKSYQKQYQIPYIPNISSISFNKIWFNFLNQKHIKKIKKNYTKNYQRYTLIKIKFFTINYTKNFENNTNMKDFIYHHILLILIRNRSLQENDDYWRKTNSSRREWQLWMLFERIRQERILRRYNCWNYFKN